MFVTFTKRTRLLTKRALRSKQYVPIKFSPLKARVHPTLFKDPYWESKTLERRSMWEKDDCRTH